jgi:hypothetical protein
MRVFADPDPAKCGCGSVKRPSGLALTFRKYLIFILFKFGTLTSSIVVLLRYILLVLKYTSHLITSNLELSEIDWLSRAYRLRNWKNRILIRTWIRHDYFGPGYRTPRTGFKSVFIHISQLWKLPSFVDGWVSISCLDLPETLAQFCHDRHQKFRRLQSGIWEDIVVFYNIIRHQKLWRLQSGIWRLCCLVHHDWVSKTLTSPVRFGEEFFVIYTIIRHQKLRRLQSGIWGKICCLLHHDSAPKTSTSIVRYLRRILLSLTPYWVVISSALKTLTSTVRYLRRILLSLTPYWVVISSAPKNLTSTVRYLRRILLSLKQWFAAPKTSTSTGRYLKRILLSYIPMIWHQKLGRLQPGIWRLCCLVQHDWAPKTLTSTVRYLRRILLSCTPWFGTKTFDVYC